MDLRELRTFIVTADAGSITRAADKLYISSVSVMNRINSLENTLGVRLFVRSNQGVTLTGAGRDFYQNAWKILELVDASIAHARHVEAEEQYVIRIGTSVLRPCKDLIDLWNLAAEDSSPFQIEIVPFSDKQESLSTLLAPPTPVVDCFLSPCDSIQWQRDFSILLLRNLPCRVGIPKDNPLSRKGRLTWADLSGQTLMLIQNGFSPVMKRMTDDIRRDHPEIRLADIPYYYDTSVFNRCVQMGFVTETLDIWETAHPSIVNRPMEWDYEMPYGIVYSRTPREPVRQFMEKIREVLKTPEGQAVIRRAPQ